MILLYGYEETGSQVAQAGLQLACCVAESDLELVTLLSHCLHADIAGVPLTPGSFFPLKLSNTILSIFLKLVYKIVGFVALISCKSVLPSLACSKFTVKCAEYSAYEKRVMAGRIYFAYNPNS